MLALKASSSNGKISHFDQCSISVLDDLQISIMLGSIELVR